MKKFPGEKQFFFLLRNFSFLNLFKILQKIQRVFRAQIFSLVSTNFDLEQSGSARPAIISNFLSPLREYFWKFCLEMLTFFSENRSILFEANFR